MRPDKIRAPWRSLAVSAALALLVAGCGQANPSSSPQSPSPKSGNPACDLITQEIAAGIDPDLTQMGVGGKPAGSRAFTCSYMDLSNKSRVLSVSLTSPASAVEIAEAKK